jgi:hypothetical protein
MPQSRTEHIKEFIGKIKSANKEFTKKEAFKDLLNRLYADNAETKEIIDAISGGAEYSILNIPLKGIEEAFGYQSHVFIQGFRELTKHFRIVRQTPEIVDAIVLKLLT